MGVNGLGISDRMGWRIVTGPDVSDWVAAQMDGAFCDKTSTSMGLERNEKLVAGVVFENFNGASITAHMAIKGLINRSYLGAIFRYAYVFCGVHKVILPVSSVNDKSTNFVSRLGFTEEGRISGAAPGGDIILYTLKKADCRYLGEKYG